MLHRNGSLIAIMDIKCNGAAGRFLEPLDDLIPGDDNNGKCLWCCYILLGYTFVVLSCLQRRWLDTKQWSMEFLSVACCRAVKKKLIGLSSHGG